MIKRQDNNKFELVSPYKPAGDQQQAIDQTHAYFKIDEATGQPAHTRGKLIMACGTGKTMASTSDSSCALSCAGGNSS